MSVCVCTRTCTRVGGISQLMPRGMELAGREPPPGKHEADSWSKKEGEPIASEKVRTR